MGAKKRQTFGKRDRERAVREKRARKEEKKEQRKLAAQGVVSDDGDVEVVVDDGPTEEETA